ncbi:MAG: hypothetical protein QOI35_2022, partial [Cryptosporangiaceae bacterium]|nr:hypothetical protein [Cryptosporangiaceae bacterium]
MTSSATTAPHAIPADHSIVVTSRWQVTDRRAQRTKADAAMAQWQHLPWPDGCLSIACLLSTEGQLLLFYAQWASEQDYRRHALSMRGRREEAQVNGGEPAATALDTTVSRLAGPPSSHFGDGPFPGCIALVTIATDGPDCQRQAAESIATFAAESHPGAVGGHVLFSLNGTRVILYAEWTSEEAHREAIASP